jgi:tetrachlorobenzoquinone reductase
VNVIDTAQIEAMKALAANKTPATLQARVRAIKWEAPGVLSLDLTAPDLAPLPAFDPGAHVDLTLPDGTLRQYSLCGDPGDTSHYRLGVRDIGGGQSSGFIHRELRPGALVTLSMPRNNFPLVDSKRYIFIAGGIGITPLIPMMRQASAQGRPWILLYCNRNAAAAPFLAEIGSLGGQVSMHSSESGTRLDPAQRLAQAEEDTLIYCCGPERLMSAVEKATQAWPPGSAHFEWFRPRTASADEASGSFEVVCQASGTTVTVPSGRSILDALFEAGIDVPCSCQQGICGTCETRVIAGEVDHRDSILSEDERAANRSMMICVSRARGPRLVLDL